MHFSPALTHRWHALLWPEALVQRSFCPWHRSQASLSDRRFAASILYYAALSGIVVGTLGLLRATALHGAE